ncbi:putative M18 family aminopeptidase 1 [Eubacterium plexicaudatum ASF492]|nr:putative M18 family aminopeptidase 1 [Eubacterium plexicaudatum ASF492]
MERKNAWEKYPEEQRGALLEFGEKYRQFISECKTERECTAKFRHMAQNAGFTDLEQIIASGESLKPGDKVYAVNKEKGLALYVIGKQPLEKGMNILGAHIDSPRLDLKQNPLYEDTELALLDTHYYGGVKKYQWVTLPLALHGVFVKKTERSFRSA